MDIRHNKTGEVVKDVKWAPYEMKWVLLGANNRDTYFSAYRGWEKIPDKKWVDVTGECQVNEVNMIFHEGVNTIKYPYRRTIIDCCGVKRIMVEKEVADKYA